MFKNFAEALIISDWLTLINTHVIIKKSTLKTYRPIFQPL